MPTTLILEDEEIASFLLFQKHHDIVLALETAGAYNIQYGKMTLNFAGGIMQNVIKEEMIYKR